MKALMEEKAPFAPKLIGWFDPKTQRIYTANHRPSMEWNGPGWLNKMHARRLSALAGIRDN